MMNDDLIFGMLEAFLLLGDFPCTGMRRERLKNNIADYNNSFRPIFQILCPAKFLRLELTSSVIDLICDTKTIPNVRPQIRRYK
ncbi:hypothetical protein [Desulfobacter vibrioformis]|uniref:hypothetical protein n=1 Tax=Desulfobacter vibrioformis TaxID=34031 RepID=UPI000553A351|nr:hypothetical protein [Desulfobacter vibrioformis]